MIHPIEFTPLPFLKSWCNQTVIGSFGLPLIDPPSEYMMIELEDATLLCCRLFTPKNRNEKKGVVLLLHGAAGSDRSHYMRRFASKLYKQGFQVISLNHRGCGRGKGLSSKLSHGGLTEDALVVLKKIRDMYPNEPIQAIGFSLGGNILLKLLGELGAEGKKYVDRAIGVCPLIDLKDASHTIGTLPFFERYYVSHFIRHVRVVEKAFPEEKKIEFPKKCSIIQFDDLYTAPKWGYQNAYDYYEKNSAKPFVSNIQVPCDLLCAEDDPFIRFRTFESATFPKCVNIRKTKHGGHLGFLGFGKSVRFMDQTVASWLEKIP